jgi:alkaline phosphatase
VPIRGIDILMGGGRRFFVPNSVVDEEGVRGARTDGRNLRAEFQSAGYTYVWNSAGSRKLRPGCVFAGPSCKPSRDSADASGASTAHKIKT